MNRTYFLIAVGAAVLATFGGCGPKWTVLEAADPNPLRAARSFDVRPLTFTGLQVGGGPEAAYLSKKEDKTRAGWREDKAALASSLARTVARYGGERSLQVTERGAKYTVHLNCDFIEPGYYAFMASQPSVVRVTAEIRQGSKLIDKILFTSATNPDPLAGNLALGQRMRSDGAMLGEYLANYLISRTVDAVP